MKRNANKKVTEKLGANSFLSELIPFENGFLVQESTQGETKIVRLVYKRENILMISRAQLFKANDVVS